MSASDDYTDAAEELAAMVDNLAGTRVNPALAGYVLVSVETLDELMEALDAFRNVEHLIEEPGE